jgi:hypothetical protein
MAVVGERGPELVQLPRGPMNNSQPAGRKEPQAAEQFMVELARVINGKANTLNEAAGTLADMLINAAAVNVQQGMLRQLTRR